MSEAGFTLPRMMPREAVIERLSKFLSGLSTDKAWSVSVKELKRTRSDAQNRYLWGVAYPAVLKGGGEALGGWTADDLHEFFLGECFGWETLEGLGRKRLRPLRRSSKLNKLEFSDYVAFVQLKAAEYGVYVPDPNEGTL